jgi:hypothetical protein
VPPLYWQHQPGRLSKPHDGTAAHIETKAIGRGRPFEETEETEAGAKGRAATERDVNAMTVKFGIVEFGISKLVPHRLAPTCCARNVDIVLVPRRH